MSAALTVLLWLTSLWLWWVPVATVRFSVSTGDSFAGSWSEEASSVVLDAVWGDLGTMVLLPIQWLLVPALAGALLTRRVDIGMSGAIGAVLGVANDLPWIASQLLLVPEGVDAGSEHAGVFFGPIVMAVPVISGVVAGLIGGGLGLLVLGHRRASPGALGASDGLLASIIRNPVRVIGAAGLLGTLVALVHVRSGLPLLPWAFVAVAAPVGLPWMVRRARKTRLSSPAAAMSVVFALSYASVVMFVAPWTWQPSPSLAGSWSVLIEVSDGRINPDGLAIDARGNVYVADGGADHVLVLSPAGVPLVEWGTPAYSGAESLAVDAEGDVYIGYIALGNQDTRGRESPGYLIRRFSPTGALLAEWGATETYGGVLSEITGLAVAPDGTVYAADWRNSRIIRLSPKGEELPAWRTGLHRPMALAPDRAGNVYVGYAGGFLIEKLSSSGICLGRWRTGHAFYGRYDLAVDHGGTVSMNVPIDEPHVLQLSPSGQVEAELRPDGDANGQFRPPVGLAVDADGALYISTWKSPRVQKFTPAISRD